jgi:hypothetical protein
MPSYHFDLVDARTAEDENNDAQFCQNDDEARAIAHDIASRVAAAEPDFLKGYCVLVSDADGLEIYRAPLQ